MMKRFLIVTGGVLLAFGMIPCCSRGPSDTSHIPGGHHHEETPVEFDKGKGLLLSKETANSLGVQIEEVLERPLPMTLNLVAHVYRESDEVSSSFGEYRNGFAYASAKFSPKSQGADVIKPGQQVGIKELNKPETDISARLLRLDNSLKDSNGSIEALFEIPDPDHRFPIGTSLQVIVTIKNETVTTIPRSALLKTATGIFVYVANGKYLFRTAVKVGAETDEYVEIKEGLYTGDQVAKQPVQSLWLAELQAIKGGKACADGH